MCAAEKEFASLAFSLLSAGRFNGQQSLNKVLEAGVAGICSGDYPGLTEVHMVWVTSETQEALQAVVQLTANAQPPKLPKQLQAKGNKSAVSSPVPDRSQGELFRSVAQDDLFKKV